MSYCRFIEGDVYVYMSVGGWLECCACTLEPEDWKSRQFSSTKDMVAHLYDHKRAGHDFPKDVINRLWEDDKENFPEDFEERRAQQKKALEKITKFWQELREEDPELFDANEHWINNPLISPTSKLEQFRDWEERIRKEEAERIIALLESEVYENVDVNLSWNFAVSVIIDLIRGETEEDKDE